MKKKVLLTTTHAGFGGVAKHVIDLAAFINNQTEWEADIFTGIQKNDLGKEFIKDSHQCFFSKYLVREVNPYYDFMAYREAYRFLQNHQYHLVHSHGPKSGFIFRRACYKLKIPCIYTHHLVVYRQFDSLLNPLYKLAEKFASNWCEKVIVVAEESKRTLSEDNVTPLEKLEVVHNGLRDLEIKYSRITAREKLSLTEDDFVLLSTSRLSPPKDPVTLLHAFIHFKKICPKAKLIFVGDGELSVKLKGIVSKTEFPNDVLFLGFQKDIDLFLASSDIFVLTTGKEGLPISILEAMKYSLPIISNPVDGVVEEVISGYNGLLCPVGDEYEISLCMSKLFEDSYLRYAMGKNGRKLLETKFSAFENYKTITNLYNQLIIRKETQGI